MHHRRDERRKRGRGAGAPLVGAPQPLPPLGPMPQRGRPCRIGRRRSRRAGAGSVKQNWRTAGAAARPPPQCRLDMILSASSGATGLRRSRAGAAGCHAGRALALLFRFAPRATAARGSRRPTPRARASARASARGGRGRGGPRAAAPARPFQRRCAIRSQRQAARLFTTVRVPHGCGGCRGSLLGRLGSVQFGPQEHFRVRVAWGSTVGRFEAHGGEFHGCRVSKTGFSKTRQKLVKSSLRGLKTPGVSPAPFEGSLRPLRSYPKLSSVPWCSLSAPQSVLEKRSKHSAGVRRHP